MKYGLFRILYYLCQVIDMQFDKMIIVKVNTYIQREVKYNVKFDSTVFLRHII